VTSSTLPSSQAAAEASGVGRRPDADLARLLVRCADRPGVVAAVSGFLTRVGANIESLQQHTTEPEGGAFFQRTEFRLPGLAAARDELEAAFAAEVAVDLGMDFTLNDRVATYFPAPPAAGK